MFSTQRMFSVRRIPNFNKSNVKKEKNVFVGVAYLISLILGMFGFAWLCYPLYRMFCQGTGLGGTTQVHKDYAPPPSDDEKASKHLIAVDFMATVGGQLPWEFKPCQKRVVVSPGETALAFFKARNLSPDPIIGMAVYHVLPAEVGIYFNKVQCFCFDEQLINPGEEVDMPVFFFLDPEVADDPRLKDVTSITLSYIFFESKSDIPEEYRDLAMARKTAKEVPMAAI